MAEIYVNTYGTIDIEVRDPAGDLVEPDGDISVTITDYNLFDDQDNSLGKVIDEGVASRVSYGGILSTGRYFYQIGPDITIDPRTLKVEWEYQVNGQSRLFTDNVFISVPYTSLNKLREIKELDGFSDQEVINMERLVSRVIDAYCGQSFGFELDKTKTVTGNGSDYLLLPGRLWELNQVRVLEDYVKVINDNDGNVVNGEVSGRDVTEYVTRDFDNPWRIRNRRGFDYIALSEVRTRHFFRNGTIYAVKGNWGYQFVPSKVSEAAAILVKTYFYDDATYRDRYLSEIQAGNWRMKFAATGDETTGSANADMMLSSYRNINAAVI
jgi:hypothetical protein